MKHFILTSGILVLGIAGWSQKQVTWTSAITKTANGLYELHLTATIKPGWHIYAQLQPEASTVEPTAITISKNPLLEIVGKAKEIGKLEKLTIPDLGLEAWQYSNKVDFVQCIKLKAKARTSLSGKVSYWVCNDEKCIPDLSYEFQVLLE